MTVPCTSPKYTGYECKPGRKSLKGIVVVCSTSQISLSIKFIKESDLANNPIFSPDKLRREKCKPPEKNQWGRGRKRESNSAGSLPSTRHQELCSKNLVVNKQPNVYFVRKATPLKDASISRAKIWTSAESLFPSKVSDLAV